MKGSGLVDVIFWLSVPLTCAHVFICYIAGPSAEGGAALARAAVCGAVGLICFTLCKEEEEA